jgi:hypothetical protein
MITFGGCVRECRADENANDLFPQVGYFVKAAFENVVDDGEVEGHFYLFLVYYFLISDTSPDQI